MKDSRLMLKNIAVFCTILFAVQGVFTGCKTVMPEVPNELSAREIVQKAQDACNDGDEDIALFYYDTLISRYGVDTSVYIEGKYEIAHIYVKAKDYAKALPVLEEIISIYDNAIPGSFPGEYYKMAKNDLAKIPAETVEKIHAKQLKKKAAAQAESIDLNTSEPETSTETSSEGESQNTSSKE